MDMQVNNNNQNGMLNVVNPGATQNFNTEVYIYSPGCAQRMHQSFKTVVASSPRYQDLISTATGIEQLLEEFLPDCIPVLGPLLADMSKLKWTLECAVDVLSLIDEAADISELQHFRRIRDVLTRCSNRMDEIHKDLLAYHTYIRPVPWSDFWRGLYLYIYARFRWGPALRKVKRFIAKRQRILDQFSHFLASRAWKPIIRPDLGAKLESLVIKRGLQQVPTLRYLQALMISVKDHLGRWIPIPLEFCSSWEDLRIVIKHSCRDGPGTTFIETDSWQLVHSETNKPVIHSAFPRLAKAHAEFSISIVLELQGLLPYVCPRCGKDNRHQSQCRGWVDCYKCKLAFSVTLYPSTASTMTSPLLPSFSVGPSNTIFREDPGQPAPPPASSSNTHPATTEPDHVEDTLPVSEETQETNETETSNSISDAFKRVTITSRVEAPEQHHVFPDDAETSGCYNDGSAYIVVMGNAGVGKSSFINHAYGRENHVIVGHTLAPCTWQVQEVRLSYPLICDEDIVLIDTPGINVYNSDNGGTNLITQQLSSRRGGTRPLFGIIYLANLGCNRIHVDQFHETLQAMREARLWNHTSSDDRLIVFAYTMWRGGDAGRMRAQQLARDYAFWPKEEAAFLRCDNNSQSAWMILDHFVKNINARFAEKFDQGLNALVTSLRARPAKSRQTGVADRIKQLGSELSRLVIDIRQSDSVSDLIAEYELKRSGLCATLEQIRGHEISREVWRRARLQMSV